MVEIGGRNLRVLPAVVGSLAGTIVFGVMMTMMDMMGMVAMLVGSESVAVGWGVHVVIGAIFGLAFAVWAAFVRFPAWVNGMVYGVAVWIVGALVLMPLLLGMPGMVLNLAAPTPWWSLVGHLMYGLVLGLVFAWMVRTGVGSRASARPRAAG